MLSYTAKPKPPGCVPWNARMTIGPFCLPPVVLSSHDSCAVEDGRRSHPGSGPAETHGATEGCAHASLRAGENRPVRRRGLYLRGVAPSTPQHRALPISRRSGDFEDVEGSGHSVDRHHQWECGYGRHPVPPKFLRVLHHSRAGTCVGRRAGKCESFHLL